MNTELLTEGVRALLILLLLQKRKVVQSLKVNLDDNIALISDSGKLLRCNVGENIRVVGRVSQGVSVFKVDSKEKIVSVARLED